jgi:hypothetical protein
MKCKHCAFRGLTWRESKKSYVRMTERGLSPDEAKELLPPCSKCCTVVMRERVDHDD